MARVVACFPQASRSRPAATAANQGKRPVFVLARPTHASRAWEWPQELGRWFRPLNRRLHYETAFGEIARWQARAQTWTQTWTVQPNQRVVRFYSLRNHSINCAEFEVFSSPLLMPYLSQAKNFSKAHAPHCLLIRKSIEFKPQRCSTRISMLHNVHIISLAVWFGQTRGPWKSTEWIFELCGFLKWFLKSVDFLDDFWNLWIFETKWCAVLVRNCATLCFLKTYAYWMDTTASTCDEIWSKFICFNDAAWH